MKTLSYYWISGLLTFTYFATGCSTKQSASSESKAQNAGVSVTMQAKSDSKLAGNFRITETQDGIKIKGHLKGLTPGAHGFHIHTQPDCSAADASSAGGHWMMNDETHGAPGHSKSHHGDLGNIVADANGEAWINSKIKGPCIHRASDCSILGHSMVVHAGADDLKSQPAGNSGARIGCGVIE